MDFFEHQENANRRTAWLLLLFALAVAAIIPVLYVTFTAILWLRASASPPVLWRPDAAVGASLATLLLVGGGAIYRRMLAGTGQGVARLLGGRSLGDTDDPTLLRLRNIVEETALAAGTAVPTIFVLQDEFGINAFAAGSGPGDAVIAVTRGSLDHLSRDELQGVIAHEFSHIVNGDIKRNLELVSLLYGILLVGQLGRGLLAASTARESSRRRSAGSSPREGVPHPSFAIVGAGLLMAGYVGLLLARLIKAAVSRQREYLADAAAVQFTRNPEGIVGALRKIGGAENASVLQTWRAEEASHMLFGNGVSGISSRLAATHPPLVDRIRRIDPSFDGTFPRIVLAGSIETLEVKDEAPPEGLSETVSLVAKPRPFLPHMVTSCVGRPSPEHLELARGLRAAIPAAVEQALHDPCGAAASVCALLIHEEAKVRERQLELMNENADPAVAAEMRRLLPEIDRCGDALRLPIVDLALPALRQLSPPQYLTFCRVVRDLANADAEIDLFEFTLHRVILRHLKPHFGGEPSPPGRLKTFAPIAREIGLVLSSLAWLGHQEREAAAGAFCRGLQALRSLDATMVIFPRERCTLSEIGSAIERATALVPRLKAELLAACAASIEHDQRVTVGEAECLRAIADYLGCPLPPLLAPS